jgi:hypothetical protein
MQLDTLGQRNLSVFGALYKPQRAVGSGSGVGIVVVHCSGITSIHAPGLFEKPSERGAAREYFGMTVVQGLSAERETRGGKALGARRETDDLHFFFIVQSFNRVRSIGDGVARAGEEERCEDGPLIVRRRVCEALVGGVDS